MLIFTGASQSPMRDRYQINIDPKIKSKHTFTRRKTFLAVRYFELDAANYFLTKMIYNSPHRKKMVYNCGVHTVLTVPTPRAPNETIKSSPECCGSKVDYRDSVPVTRDSVLHNVTHCHHCYSRHPAAPLILMRPSLVIIMPVTMLRTSSASRVNFYF